MPASVQRRDRKWIIRGRLLAGSTVVADAEGLFVAIPERFSEAARLSAVDAPV